MTIERDLKGPFLWEVLYLVAIVAQPSGICAQLHRGSVSRERVPGNREALGGMNY